MKLINKVLNILIIEAIIVLIILLIVIPMIAFDIDLETIINGLK